MKRFPLAACAVLALVGCAKEDPQAREIRQARLLKQLQTDFLANEAQCWADASELPVMADLCRRMQEHDVAAIERLRHTMEQSR